MVDRRIGLLIIGVILIAFFLWIFFMVRGLISKRVVNTFNPFETTLTVNIGDDKYSLAPDEFREIELEEGQFRIKSTLNNELILDTNIRITAVFLKEDGVINVSGQSVYRWSEYYGSTALEDIYSMGNDSSSRAVSPIEQSREQSSSFLRIDSTLVYGIIKEYSGKKILLVKDWDYDMNQGFEDEIPAKDHLQVMIGKTASKLFTKKEMLNYWRENYGDILEK